MSVSVVGVVGAYTMPDDHRLSKVQVLWNVVIRFWKQMEVTTKCPNGGAGLKVAVAASAEDDSAASGLAAAAASANNVNNRKDVGGGATSANSSSGGGGTLLQMHKPLAHLLAHRQWWKVCWVYGDQQKYYRQLYGRKKNLTTLRSTATVSTNSANNDDDNHPAAGDEDDAGPSSFASGPCYHTLE